MKGKGMRKQAVTVGYGRTSTTRQDISLELQEQKISAYASLTDLPLSEVITDLTSGKTVNGRAGCKRLLEMIRAGKVDNLIIYKLDRLGRNLKELCDIADLLREKGCTLHALTEKLDTSTASGRFFFNLLGSMAQWERETIAERTRAALQHKKSKGERVSGRAPFGSRFVDGRVIKNDTEQAIISEAKALRAAGASLRVISARLAERSHFNRCGHPFGKDELASMIRATPQGDQL